MGEYTLMRECPACSKEVIQPRGPKMAKVLLLGEFPGRDEINKGIPFVGMTGKVLTTELARLGLDIRQFRVTNLWRHVKPAVGATKESKAAYEACLDAMIVQALRAAKDKQAILLIGSDTVKIFASKAVSDVNGMNITGECSLLQACPIIYASVNPATVFHGGLGEIRFALEKFASAIEHLTE